MVKILQMLLIINKSNKHHNIFYFNVLSVMDNIQEYVKEKNMAFSLELYYTYCVCKER